jgi:hypothetical protein
MSGMQQFGFKIKAEDKKYEIIWLCEDAT